VSYYSLASNNSGNLPDVSPTWWSPEPIGGSFTNVTSITGPTSGSGALNLTAGTGNGAVLQTVGSSGGTGFNQVIGSQGGNGVAQVVGGTTAASYATLEPDSSLPYSNVTCGVTAGGGTALGQTFCNTTATNDALGYFNPIPSRFLVRDTLSSPNRTIPIFENGAEGCVDNVGNFTTATCGFALPVHWYWWVFSSPGHGYGAMDYRPGPGGDPKLWTADKGQWLYYSPVAIQSKLTANTIGGGANAATAVTAGPGSGNSSNLTCAAGHVCTAIHGTVTFTTGGTAITGQPLFTLSSSIQGTTLTREAIPDCTGTVTDFAGHSGVLIFSGPTVTSQSAYAGISLSGSTAYTATYTCLGN
jgi:hypothetical protein